MPDEKPSFAFKSLMVGPPWSVEPSEVRRYCELVKDFGATAVTANRVIDPYSLHVLEQPGNPYVWFTTWGPSLDQYVSSELTYGLYPEVYLRRNRLALRRMKGRPAWAFAAACGVFALAGGWIFYNTNVVNDYRSDDEKLRIRAAYEERYKQYEGLPQPRLRAIPTGSSPASSTVDANDWADAVLRGRAGGDAADIRAAYNVGGNYVTQGADVARCIRAMRRYSPIE